MLAAGLCRRDVVALPAERVRWTEKGAIVAVRDQQIELVRACPDTRFMLDHLAKPNVKDHVRDPWWAQLAELAQIEREHAALKHRSDLLDPRKADPDMADELVRKDLGLVRPDEVIIPLD